MHVIHLHSAKRESGRNTQIHPSAEHNGPCRVAFTSSKPYEAPRVAEKRMCKEHRVAARIKELRTHRKIAHIQLRAVLSCQLGLHSESVCQIKRRGNIKTIQV